MIKICVTVILKYNILKCNIENYKLIHISIIPVNIPLDIKIASFNIFITS